MSRLLNERGAARYLGLSIAHVRALHAGGELRAEQVTLRRCMFDATDLERYAETTGRQRTYKFKHETVTVIYDEETR